MKFNQKTIGAGLFVIAAIAGGIGYKVYTNHQEQKAKEIAEAEQLKKKMTPHWQYITSSKKDDYEGFFPPSNATAGGEDIKKIWIKRTPSTANQGYTKTNYSISCKYKTISYDQIVTYDNKGAFTGDYSYPVVWQNVIPDTVFAGIVTEVCNY